MSEARRILGLSHLLTGLLVVTIAVPLIMRRVKMNRVYGIRIAKAFTSEANWYAVNAFGGKVLVCAGGIVSAIGLCAMVWPPVSLAETLVVAFAPAPVLLLSLIPILRFGRGLE